MTRIVDEALIKCPYYLNQWKDNHGRLNISCEGIIDGMASVNCKFDSEKAIVGHMVVNCCSFYNECPIAKLIEQKYKEENENGS